jgi:predicted cobalt transporter CbtA
MKVIIKGNWAGARPVKKQEDVNPLLGGKIEAVHYSQDESKNKNGKAVAKNKHFEAAITLEDGSRRLLSTSGVNVRTEK